MRILILVISILLLAACSPSSAVVGGWVDVKTDWTDGSACDSDVDCAAIDYGCGGGHTMCTSEPEQYEGRMSTCEIVENHPSSESFDCECLESKCAWVR